MSCDGDETRIVITLVATVVATTPVRPIDAALREWIAKHDVA